MVKIYLASDHAGFSLKQKIKKFLEKKKITCVDMGDFQKNDNDDYPDFVLPLAKKVAQEKNAKGIIVGGSGQGEAIAANKIKGVRAALYYGGNKNILKLSREHNDANILSLGARFLKEKEALSAINLWLKTPFSHDARHMRRINKVDELGSR
ncbi:MAG: RpiB/LacA/LacB family sugar-phosphate isomerase [Nanoarchaeota archaeon]